MGLTQITKPAFDLFSPAVLKDLVGIQDAPGWDAELYLWVRAATDWVERYTNRVLRESTWRLTLPEFPKAGRIDLPLFPVQSIAGVQYRDASGVLQTWEASKYIAMTHCDPVAIYPAPGEAWPNTQARRPDAVVITLIAGYELLTDSTYDAPDALSLAVQSFVRDRWNRRLRPRDKGHDDIDEPADVVVKVLLNPFVRLASVASSVQNLR